MSSKDQTTVDASVDAVPRTHLATRSHARDALGQRQLIVVTGKGGVGKSALTGVLARHLAARGRRVLALEVDRRETLQRWFGVPPSGGEILEVSGELTEGLDGSLHLQNLQPSRVVDWVVEKKVKIGPLVRRIQNSPVYQRFVEGAPGLGELAILGHALRVVRGDAAGAPPIDTVILDAPATGHGIFLLTAPALVADTIGQGPFSELAREVADFVADPGRCGMVVVTLAEEMPVQEALELRQNLVRVMDRGPELLVVNGLYPPLPDGVGEAQPADGIAVDDFRDLWFRRRRVNDSELDRLGREWPGPRLDLPLLPIDEGPELLAALEEHFSRLLESAPVEEDRS